MNELWFKIKQVGAFILFILVSSLIGLVTGKPIMMVAYGLFFLLVLVVVLLLSKKSQRHFEIKVKDNSLLHKVVGIVLALAALVIPVITLKWSSLIPITGEVGASILMLAAGLTIAFLVLILGALHLMNSKQDSQTIQIAGYIAIIIASSIPGIAMLFVDRSTAGIGSAYYVALGVLILGVNGYNLITKKD